MKRCAQNVSQHARIFNFGVIVPFLQKPNHKSGLRKPNGWFGIGCEAADNSRLVQPRLGFWPLSYTFRIMLLDCKFLDRGIERSVQFMSDDELHTVAA